MAILKIQLSIFYLAHIFFFFLFIDYTISPCPFPFQRCICTGSTPYCPCASITSSQTLNFSSSYVSHLVLVSNLGCRPCPPNCKKCSSIEICTQCFDQFQLKSNICISCSINCKKCKLGVCQECIDTYYIDYQKKCQKCPLQGSKSCTIDSLRSCQPNYWLDNNGAECVNCDANCKTCSSTTKCSKCNNGFYESDFKCLACMPQCKSCSNNFSCTQCIDKGNFFNSTMGSCTKCPTVYCIICNSTSGTCLQCDYNNGYYLEKSTNKCIYLDPSYQQQIKNCQNLTSNSTISNLSSSLSSLFQCQKCVDGYYSLNDYNNVSSLNCYYGCSILCNTCSGPHYGTCDSCLDQQNYDLINKQCIPHYNVNQGAQFQYFYTAFNNNSSFEAPRLILPNSCWHEYVKGGSSSVSIRISNLSSYKIKLKWKIYKYNFTDGKFTNNNESYQIILSNSLLNSSNSSMGYSFLTTTCQLRTAFSTICSQGSINQCIDKNQVQFSQISSSQNLIKFLSLNSFIAISQLLIVGYRCGGIYGEGCSQCSDINTCTKCYDSNYYLIGQKCIAQCPNTHYTYEQFKKCYQICPLGSFRDDSLHQCFKCVSPCQSCNTLNQCITCKQGFYYNKISQTCQSECPLTYYKDNYRRVCQRCPSPCLSCLNSSICYTCRYGFLQRFVDVISNSQSLNQSLISISNMNFTKGQGTCVLQCMDGYFANLQDLQCDICSQKCKTCLNYNDSCLSCYNNTFFYQNTCLPQCPIGYFPNITTLTCDLCLNSCQMCKNQSYCQKCSTGFYLSKYNNLCFTSCQKGFYQQEVLKECRPCNIRCSSCKTQNICSSCVQGYYFLQQNYQCLSTCPRFYYTEQILQVKFCLRCQLPCYECFSKQVCLSCYDSFLYNGSCSLICPSGYYANVTSLKCQICNLSLCLQCKNQPNQCLKCPNNLLLVNSRCLDSCPQGFYFSQYKNQCLLCSGLCQTCKNSTFCLTCMKGFVLVQETGECLNACLQGFYKYNLTSQIFQCLQCPLNCSSCYYNYSNQRIQCYQCRQGYNFYLNLCYQNCPNGFYNQSGFCLPCSFPCQSCRDGDYCLKCYQKYGYLYQGACLTQCPYGYFNDQNSQCQKCSLDCLVCEGNASNCIACTENLYLSSQQSINLSSIANSSLVNNISSIGLMGNNLLYPRLNFSCEINCSDGYYISAIDSQCQLCSTNCKICQNTFDQCTACFNDYLLHENKCIKNCPLQFYVNQTSQKCDKCPLQCYTCQNASFCLICSNNFYLTKNNQCRSECKLNEYSFDGLCRECSFPCKSCIQSQFKCLSCLIGIYYQNQCIEQCPQGSFYTVTNSTVQQCVKCTQNCSKCINLEICLFCSSGILYNGNCVEKCPQKYFSIYGICQSCMQNCQSCQNRYTCNNCTSGYMYQSKCLLKCPEGFVGQNISISNDSNNFSSQCINCDIGCTSCYKNPSRCTSCVQNMYLYIDQCVIICPSGSYADDKLSLCQPCVSPCETCSNSFSCNTCIYGYLLYSQSSRNQCVEGPLCPNNYFLNLDNNVCYFICPDNYYINLKQKTCSKNCSDNFVTDIQNKLCLQACPQNMWIDQDKICRDNSIRPSNLPELKCKPLIVRNLLFLSCSSNLQLANILDLKTNDIKLSKGVPSLIKFNSNKQFYLLVSKLSSKFKGDYLSVQLVKRYHLFSKDTAFQIQSTKQTSNQASRISPQVKITGSQSNRLSPKQDFKKVSLAQINSYPVQNYKIEVLVENYTPFSLDQRQIGINFYQIGQSISFAALILWVFSLLKNIKANSLTFLINLQWLFSLSLLSIGSSNPPNINQFLQSFNFSILISWDTFSLTSNNSAQEKNLWYLKQLQRDQFWTINNYYDFQVALFGVYLLMGSFLAIYLITLSLSKLVKIQRLQQKEWAIRISKKSQILNERFQFNYTYHLILFTSNPISICTNLQLIKPNISGLVQSALFVVFYIVFIIGCIIIYIKSKQNKEGYKNKKPIRSTAYFFIVLVQILVQNIVIIWGSFYLYVGFGIILIILNIVAFSWIYQKIEPSRCFYLQLIQISKGLILIILVIGQMKKQKWTVNQIYYFGFAQIAVVFILIFLSSLTIAKDLFSNELLNKNKSIHAFKKQTIHQKLHKDQLKQKIKTKNQKEGRQDQFQSSVQTSGFQNQDQMQQEQSFFSNKTPLSESQDDSDGDIIDFDQSEIKQKYKDRQNQTSLKVPPRHLFKYENQQNS